MKNIVLTGFMASGKTTIGKAMAYELGYEFIDIDKLIVEHEKKTIADIFENFGEKYFRQLESEMIKKISDFNNKVIATGGGAVLKKSNIETLRKNGVIILIDTPLDVVVSRLAHSNTGRPLIDNAGVQEIHDRYEQRKTYYDNCDYRINTSNKKLGEIVNEIKMIYNDCI